MTTSEFGRYRVRQTTARRDVLAAQRLRALSFFGPDGPDRDEDAFDAHCTHFLVEDAQTGQLVCVFRSLPLENGREIGRSYSAQFYELSALKGFSGKLVEIGRFCVHPDHVDADILRAAWGALTQYVDANGVELLFGCSSFAGTDAKAYTDAFAMLRDRHLAPRRWWPDVKAPDVFRFATRLRRKPDRKRALLAMPPLLRTYLMMGGWVSDHAVVDRQLNTLHVFTGLEIDTIPPARKRLLREMAA